MEVAGTRCLITSQVSKENRIEKMVRVITPPLIASLPVFSCTAQKKSWGARVTEAVMKTYPELVIFISPDLQTIAYTFEQPIFPKAYAKTTTPKKTGRPDACRYRSYNNLYRTFRAE